MIDATLLLSIILYVCLIILVIAAIVLIVKLVMAINKADKILDNVSHKAEQLNSTFDIVDNVTSTINGISGKISSVIVDGVTKIVDRRKKDE